MTKFAEIQRKIDFEKECGKNSENKVENGSLLKNCSELLAKRRQSVGLKGKNEHKKCRKDLIFTSTNGIIPIREFAL